MLAGQRRRLIEARVARRRSVRRCAVRCREADARFVDVGCSIEYGIRCVRILVVALVGVHRCAQRVAQGVVVAARFQRCLRLRFGARLLHDILDQLVDARLFHIWLGRRGPSLDHTIDLLVGDVRALDAARLDGVGAHVEHVAATEQLFGAGLIHDHAGVGLRGGGEGDAGREVGFD